MRDIRNLLSNSSEKRNAREQMYIHTYGRRHKVKMVKCSQLVNSDKVYMGVHLSILTSLHLNLKLFI